MKRNFEIKSLKSVLNNLIDKNIVVNSVYKNVL